MGENLTSIDSFKTGLPDCLNHFGTQTKAARIIIKPQRIISKHINFPHEPKIKKFPQIVILLDTFLDEALFQWQKMTYKPQEKEQSQKTEIFNSLST